MGPSTRTPLLLPPLPPKDVLAPRPSRLGEHGQDEPGAAQHGRDDGVRQLDGVARAGELQAQAAVDDAQDDDHAAVPEVQVRGDGAAQEALEVAVVQPAQQGLGEEEEEHHDADDGVVVEVWVRELEYDRGLATGMYG